MRVTEKQIKQKIFNLVKEYYARYHSRRAVRSKVIQYGGRVYDEKEILALVDAALEFWLTYGWRSRKFEARLANLLGIKHAVFTNSGSSANLLAIASLCSGSFGRRLKAGDEVITPATTFPTTINPLIQYGLRPVLVDSTVGTYNIDCSHLEDALGQRTRAIMLPHILGNPGDLDRVMEVAEIHDLILVEDVCESFGAKFRGRYVGTFGELSTFSFYGPHHITTGEGGAVCTDQNELGDILVSLRDWGRAGTRLRTRDMPMDYDQRYVYTNIGYNLRPLDLQAAIGLIQLTKLKQFRRRRRENFDALNKIFSKYQDYFVLPSSLRNADPVWFAYPLTVRDNAKFHRADIVLWLERHGIETRSTFAGNIARQPAYKSFRFRKIGRLRGAETILRTSFFMGLYPGIGLPELQYVEVTVNDFFKSRGVSPR